MCPRGSVCVQHSDGQCEHTLRLPDSFLACCALSDLRLSFCDHVFGSSENNSQSITHHFFFFSFSLFSPFLLFFSFFFLLFFLLFSFLFSFFVVFRLFSFCFPYFCFFFFFSLDFSLFPFFLKNLFLVTACVFFFVEVQLSLCTDVDSQCCMSTDPDLSCLVVATPVSPSNKQEFHTLIALHRFTSSAHVGSRASLVSIH